MSVTANTSEAVLANFARGMFHAIGLGVGKANQQAVAVAVGGRIHSQCLEKKRC